MHGKIYLVRNKINGKSYVGQTTGYISNRYRAHIRHISSILSKAILKYGESNFELSVIGEYENQEALDLAECQFIEKLNTTAPNGYNIRPGGSRGKISEETKEKLSIVMKISALGNTNRLGTKQKAESIRATTQHTRIHQYNGNMYSINELFLNFNVHNLGYTTIYRRIMWKKWTPEKALNTADTRHITNSRKI